MYRFEGALRDTLHEFKYNGMRVLAHPLGYLLGRHLDQHPVPVDTIIPVPLHARRLRSRGYNQSALLARDLGGASGKPVVMRSLVRQRETAPQVSLGPAARRANVQDAFVCINDALQARDVLLVDDVCTTGATLEACAVALHEVGAKSVRALTLARAIAV
ncbi:MAG: ComF family protein [Anaerolineae bacterium]|nr:ComF family protein [Anaerolineae bacterium]